MQLVSNFIFASFATDGCDYLEGVHGAIVTNKTIDLIDSLGINTEDYIEKFNTYELHKRLGTLIEGPLSGTNCSDVYVLVFIK